MAEEKKKRVMLSLSKDVAEALDKLAKEVGLSKSGLVTTWINANRKDSEQKK